MRQTAARRAAGHPTSRGGLSSWGAGVEESLSELSILPSSYGWGFVRAMRIHEVHEAGITGKGVRVAVLDTGVGPHPDLVVQSGINTTDAEERAHWQDTHWHGTHVAGILAGIGMPGGLKGVAPEAELFAVRVGRVDAVESSQFRNESIESDLLEGLEWCLDQGIQVVNMSLFVRPSDALEKRIEQAYQQGMILVAPAGNRRSSRESFALDFPASSPFVFGVGAVGRLGTYGASSYFRRAELGASFSPTFPSYYIPQFSKRGAGLDFVAPGVGILSTVPPHLKGWDEQDQSVTGYTTWMGTSHASPFIAGLCALILEAHPQLLTLPGEQRVAEVRNILEASCVSLGLDSTLEGAGMPYAPRCIDLVTP